MADYYQLIARAVAGLGKNTAGALRFTRVREGLWSLSSVVLHRR